MSKEPKGFMVDGEGRIYFQGERTTVRLTGYSYLHTNRIEREARRLRAVEGLKQSDLLGITTLPLSVRTQAMEERVRRKWPRWDLGVMSEESLIKFASRG